MKNISKSVRVSLAQQLIVGTKKHFPNGSQVLPVGGAQRTVTDVTTQLQSVVDLRQVVIASQATTKSKVAAEREQGTSLAVQMADFVAFLRFTFGKQPEVLADFGVTTPKSPTPLTAEQKAVAAVKRKATRQARHTMGTNQKKNVKGAVSAALVVTPLSGSTPAVVSATAPAASSESPTGGSTPHAS
jgi:hypothetical protein